MFKQAFYAGFVSLVVISSANPIWAITVESVPNPRRSNGGWVTDMANLLDSPTEKKLNQMISALEAQNGSEIAIVTVPNTAPATPKVFTNQLFNHWKIGKRQSNNGVLVLISKGDRRTQIATGKGLKATLPDQRVSQIIKQQITPAFKQGNFNQGTLAGTQALIDALNNKTPGLNRPIATQTQSKEQRLLGGIILLAFVSVGVGIVVALQMLKRSTNLNTRSNRHCPDRRWDSSNRFWHSSDNSYSSSDRSSSSSDFGGGSSNGGGSGDSW
jgi:uncharacterized protein